MEGPSVRSRLEADQALARSLRIEGTPTFFVNGRPIVGAHPVETFREVVEEALRERR
ncbi:MAG: DsbA family protein [Candidatus Rokuibacteriota bacterium]